MKKIIICAMISLLLMALVGCGNTNTENTNVDSQKSNEELSSVENTSQTTICFLGDLDVSLELPKGHWLDQQTSEQNDYFATSRSGDYAVIANFDEIEDFDYTLEDYAKSTAEANNAETVATTEDGHYYFTYKNGEYHYYASIRQSEKGFYRVTFYCFENDWSTFERLFSNWAATIKVYKLS